jgi:tRNA pseudouridine(55) synthase
MFFIDKKIGETPLEVLGRARNERPERANERLSYAGRLDPMAEGVMLIIEGNENNEREKFLGLDKEYVATFLVGVATDTGDCLGLITKQSSVVVSEKDILSDLDEIKKLTEQRYPWFSGKTVDGIKLFDHYKKGNVGIERPTQHINIKEVEFLGMETRHAQEIHSYIVDSIKKVNGDFRQEEILAGWKTFFGNSTEKQSIQTFQVRFVVSSGTFIRGLTEYFSFPATLLTLKRTRIIGV